MWVLQELCFGTYDALVQSKLGGGLLRSCDPAEGSPGATERVAGQKFVRVATPPPPTSSASQPPSDPLLVRLRPSSPR